MSKKISPSEALNKVAYCYGYDKNIEIIEAALKEREKYRKRCLELGERNFELIEENKKQDEILRIIKEKNVNVHGIINAPTLEYYDDHCRPRHSKPLNQVEFDILKEASL